MRGYDKWGAYLPLYKRTVEQIKPGSNYLEIGVQNMGWLSAMDPDKKFIHCVACDINPKVADHVVGTRFDDVVVGDSTAYSTFRQIADLGLEFDLIVDDASHTQYEIIQNFLLYFSLLRDGGFFMIEDCHTDFTQSFEHKNYFGLSIYGFFSALAALPTLITIKPTLCMNNQAYRVIRQYFSVQSCDAIIRGLKEISFSNSCILISKGDSGLGQRLIVGDEWPIVSAEELRTFNLGMLRAPNPPQSPQLAVVYLNRLSNAQEVLGRDRFLAAYRRFPPKVPHQLYVINKGITEEALHTQYLLFGDLGARFIFVTDAGNDLTAYKTAASQIEEPIVFFMNTYSEPLHPDWLDIVYAAFLDPDVKLAGCTGSFETHHPFRPGFAEFPNYHIRTTSFMIETERFREITCDINFGDKNIAYQFEGGVNSMTRQIESCGKRAVIVGRQGVPPARVLWRSGIFRAGRQGNLLVADNHTRAYDALGIFGKLSTWGATWFGLTQHNSSIVRWVYQFVLRRPD